MGSVPDKELLIILKWAFVLIITVGFGTIVNLSIRRWWFKKEENERRVSNGTGWLPKFIETQTAIAARLQEIIDRLRENGKALKAMKEDWNCKYDPNKD